MNYKIRNFESIFLTNQFTNGLVSMSM